MKYRLEVANQSHKIDLVRNELGILTEIFIDDQKFLVSDLNFINGLNFEKNDEIIHFNLNNELFDVKLKEIPTDSNNSANKNNNLDQLKEFFKSGLLLSPMPGKIIDMRCSEGDIISKGKLLLSLEAMKMENEILAPFKLKVNKILVTVNNTVTDKQSLLEYEELPEDE